MSTLSELLHILLCKKYHAVDMLELGDRQDGACYYWLERDIDKCETLPDHVEWERNSKIIGRALGFETDEDALEFVEACIETARRVRTLAPTEPKLRFLLDILDS